MLAGIFSWRTRYFKVGTYPAKRATTCHKNSPPVLDSLSLIHPETGNTLPGTGTLRNLKNPAEKKPRSCPCQAARMTNCCLNVCLIFIKYPACRSSAGGTWNGALAGLHRVSWTPHTCQRGALSQSPVDLISCNLATQNIDLIHARITHFGLELEHPLGPETSWNQCPP